MYIKRLNWFTFLLNVIPYCIILEYFLDWLELQARKTSTVVDDHVVQSIRKSLANAFPQCSSLSD